MKPMYNTYLSIFFLCFYLIKDEHEGEKMGRRKKSESLISFMIDLHSIFLYSKENFIDFSFALSSSFSFSSEKGKYINYILTHMRRHFYLYCISVVFYSL